MLPGPKWHRIEFTLPNNAAGGATKRRMAECLWLNYDPTILPDAPGLVLDKSNKTERLWEQEKEEVAQNEA
jgi:hypothetical protein